MCFTVNVNLIKEELENRYGADLIDPDKYRPSYYYHAYGLPEMPALCSGSPGKIRLLKWGLIPSWTRNIDDAKEIRLKTFNARSESVETKPSFSISFKTKRCIVPVRGFFEWQHLGKEKVPWYIYRADDDIMSLAGLYDEWVENNTGEQFTTFTIITTDANILMSEIHNSKKRMPAILDKSSESLWLDISNETEKVKTLLKPASEEILKAHTVSPLINSRTSSRNTPDIIKPWKYNQQTQLF
ncbi:MAG TPA: SOS response-associated peptidase [Bacteroidales bacterium]|nr:SOS response-associated peptidase [Bacteroidales bacterium]